MNDNTAAQHITVRALDLDSVVEHSHLEAIFGPAVTSIIGVAPWDELSADSAEYFAVRSTSLRRVIRRERNDASQQLVSRTA